MNSSEPILPAIAAGDRSAVARCLDRFGGLVWSMARRYLRDDAEAEDAVQEVFIELWQKADIYDPARGAESTFVTMLARRRLIDRMRRNDRRPEAASLESTIDVVAVQDADVDSLVSQEEARRVRDGLEQLRDEEQRVIRLAIFDGLSQTQISQRLDMPLGTVKSHALRGIKKLRAGLRQPPTPKTTGENS
ncbi:sigma-70 family RNA polymerase sigma factor [Stratiformator vulcanicus]|uniref:ECF RNA polymerase sigma factor SigK n=1 Tax=Stratiformator vulcanicus TaxID=2527980 RepID=A0A517R6Z8_9PLAN|nr:sigma-70 family RNA polymerase sigma factor [Stratiformator vulcanicus]QDT39622.1 ECF RNA polymerase sigma factor SigK [Stratiformator vulcanicus]